MQTDFDPAFVLRQPLMIYLASLCEEGPRSSPLWFLYEEDKIWLFGLKEDSFVKRLQKDSRCGLSVVDFSLSKGKLLHVGIRGEASLDEICPR